MTSVNYSGGSFESQGLFKDPVINSGGGLGPADPISFGDGVDLSGNITGGVLDTIFSYFDYIFYFIYMIIKIPLTLLGWIFGFGTGSGSSGFFASLLSGEGLLGYLGYFFSSAPFSDLFGNGIGKEGGYSLGLESFNPFAAVKNFFVNPFGGPSFAELFFMGTSGFWWLGVFALLGGLMYSRKKIKDLDKQTAELYDNIEEYEEDDMFHDEEKKKRWKYIVGLLSSAEKDDWKTSIILADDLMTDVFEDHDLSGSLKQIFSKVDMKSSSEAITSRTIAEAIEENKVASLSKIEAKAVLDDYSRVFKELYHM